MIGKTARAARPQPGHTPDQVLGKLGGIPGVKVSLICAFGEMLTVNYTIDGVPKIYHGKRTFNWDLLVHYIRENWVH